MKINLYAPLLVFLILVGSCSKDDNISTEKRAYIVGFDPCTINHSYKIGYVIITKDLKDTLITYSLSDKQFKMPASILLIPNDTLYKIPEAYFNNYRNSIYFPDSLRYKYQVDIDYSFAKENEMVFYVCTTDIISLTLPQIIINGVKK